MGLSPASHHPSFLPFSVSQVSQSASIKGRLLRPTPKGGERLIRVGKCRCGAWTFFVFCFFFFPSPAALTVRSVSEWLLSRWMIGMKLLLIDKQRERERERDLSVISCVGGWFTPWFLIYSDLTCLPTCLSTQRRVDQPGPTGALKPRLFAVTNGRRSCRWR